MKLSHQQIQVLVDHPERATSGEERRLLKILSGRGKPCTPAERRAESYAREYKRSGRLEVVRRVANKLLQPAKNQERPPMKSRYGHRPLGHNQLALRNRTSQWIKKLAIDTSAPRPVDYKQYIDEGIAGSREDNKRSRANNSRDSRLRNK